MATKPAPMDGAKFRRAYHLWRPVVHGVLRKAGVDEADIEDLAHDTFLLVWSRNRPEPGWMVNVARALAANYGRKAHRYYEVRIPKAIEKAPAPYEDPEDRTSVREALSLIEGADLLVAFELADVPHHELAQRIGKSTSTAHNRVAAAREHMRRLLDERAESPE